MDRRSWSDSDFLNCSGSHRFAREMSATAPFSDLSAAIEAARDIWFNKVDVNGWLESFAAHPEIGASSKPISQWSREEQSAAMASATDSTMQELLEWNGKYKEKFGFIFIICASGRSTHEILAELKKRYQNRHTVELEIAAQEEMKIIELRLQKLFEAEARTPSEMMQDPSNSPNRTEDRLGIIGAHLTAIVGSSTNKSGPISGSNYRSRPPITTHVLDVSRGGPASGIEVQLEMWKGSQPYPSFRMQDSNQWIFQGSSVTDNDGRCGALMSIVDRITPGFYRISFNTGRYNPSGFYPFVSIVFQIRENQQLEHFHVPLLLSPFSISSYRGS